MLSGIGPKIELRRHGIKQVIELPVGKNLQDHCQVWLPDCCSQIFRLYMFGPSGFWTMAPLRYTAKLDPFLSLDCATIHHPGEI